LPLKDILAPINRRFNKYRPAARGYDAPLAHVLIWPLLNMARVKCPQCGTETEYEGNEFRPFCSERCKLLDFGAWADEQYNLPVEGTALNEEDLQEIENILKKRGSE
jgi:uncharacterized protein